MKPRRTNSQSTDHIKYTVRQSKSYPPQTEPRVIHDLIQCFNLYPTLYPTLQTFLSSNGIRKQLIALTGTVPISYKGSFYKIPVHIWVMSNYPSDPPLMFVVPTTEMVFRQNHPHVDHTNGLVYLPYLSTWNPSNCELLGTVKAMVHAFSVKPPVYSRVALKKKEQDEETRHLIQHLSQRVTAALQFRCKELKDRMKQIQQKKKWMETNINQYHSSIRRLSDVQERQAVLQSSKENLLVWNTIHPKLTEDENIDCVTYPKDKKTEQILKNKALDFAISDAMNQIDEAVVQNVIHHDVYIQKIRKLAREQFFTRILVGKLQNATPQV